MPYFLKFLQQQNEFQRQSFRQQQAFQQQQGEFQRQSVLQQQAFQRRLIQLMGGGFVPSAASVADKELN